MKVKITTKFSNFYGMTFEAKEAYSGLVFIGYHVFTNEGTLYFSRNEAEVIDTESFAFALFLL